MEDIQSTELNNQNQLTPTDSACESVASNVSDDVVDAKAEPVAVANIEAVPEPEVAGKSLDEVEALSDDDLLGYVRSLMQASSARVVLKAVNEVKAVVAKRVEAAVADEKKAFEEANPADAEQPAPQFVPSPNKLEAEFNVLFASFEVALAQEREELRKAQEANTVQKQEILDKLKQIVESAENPSSHIRAVKELQAKWKEIGPVSPEKKDINREFREISDQYFNKLNVDRELRDLDMRRNLTEKIKLCEEAEALKDADSASNAFYTVQRLHATWKSLGPVPADKREELWNRFREATAVVNKRFHKQTESDRERQKQNYVLKSQICDEAQAIADKELKTSKEYDDASNAIVELQKKWRTIGFAPKDVNDEIYARFRAICDKVFEAKRQFFKEQNSQLSENYKLKEALCVKAEEVMNSTDWKKTANYLIELQKQWKEVGAVSYKQSDAIWKRFRKACDTFFDNRQRQIEGEKGDMEQNLALKLAIIDELKAFTPSSNSDEYLKQIQAFISRWNAIGYVPMQNKQAVNKEYSDLIGKHFDKLNIGQADGELQRFRSRMESMLDDKARLVKERSRLQQQHRQAEADVDTLENNIMFFSKSKNSEGIVANVKSKIEKAKADAAQIAKKISIIDELLG